LEAPGFFNPRTSTNVISWFSKFANFKCNLCHYFPGKLNAAAAAKDAKKKAAGGAAQGGQTGSMTLATLPPLKVGVYYTQGI
jgi:hypothetical protein